MIVILSTVALVTGCRLCQLRGPTVPDAPEWSDPGSDKEFLSATEETGLHEHDFNLPQRTPFDSTNELRKAYLDGYCLGVRWALNRRGHDDYLTRVGSPELNASCEGFDQGCRDVDNRVTEVRRSRPNKAAQVTAPRVAEPGL